ncbi:hypothetical protein SEA_DUMPTRUCK_35 [Gordonia phage DumpTruck]|nr:hypothetical protein SEA_DUMPTRUCK_35 [Gordonia phage DumpTruck]
MKIDLEVVKEGFKTALHNFIDGTGHTVGYPVYRVLVLFMLPPCLLQLIFWQAPTSVQDQTPAWYDAVFILLQLTGALFTLVSLAMGDTPDAARVERPGCWLIGGMGVVYFIVAWKYTGAVPLTVASWLQLGLSVFCFIRLRQISRLLGRMERRVERESPNVE